MGWTLTKKFIQKVLQISFNRDKQISQQTIERHFRKSTKLY